MMTRFKASETLLGIETSFADRATWTMSGFKASETLLGIETPRPRNRLHSLDCFKASETLLGIETRMITLAGHSKDDASKPLKPF